MLPFISGKPPCPAHFDQSIRTLKSSGLSCPSCPRPFAPQHDTGALDCQHDHLGAWSGRKHPWSHGRVVHYRQPHPKHPRQLGTALGGGEWEGVGDPNREALGGTLALPCPASAPQQGRGEQQGITTSSLFPWDPHRPLPHNCGPCKGLCPTRASAPPRAGCRRVRCRLALPPVRGQKPMDPRMDPQLPRCLEPPAPPAGPAVAEAPSRPPGEGRSACLAFFHARATRTEVHVVVC